jgi:hypothetical protein
VSWGTSPWRNMLVAFRQCYERWNKYIRIEKLLVEILNNKQSFSVQVLSLNWFLQFYFVMHYIRTGLWVLSFLTSSGNIFGYMLLVLGHKNILMLYEYYLTFHFFSSHCRAKHLSVFYSISELNWHSFSNGIILAFISFISGLQD